MSNFGEELNRQLAAREINAVVLGERVNMSSSQIYNWTRGVQTTVSTEQFNLLAAALTDDPNEHAKLLYAHLLDEKADVLGTHLVEVQIAESAALRDKPRSRSKRERALEILAGESVKDRELADLLISLASYVNSDLTEAEGKIVSAIRREAAKENTRSRPLK
jgi:hypothetical protein